MCTTNAVESINSSFRKVTKKGAFPNEMHYSNWSIYAQPSFTKSGMAVRFKIGYVQISTGYEWKISARIKKYEHMI